MPARYPALRSGHPDLALVRLSVPGTTYSYFVLSAGNERAPRRRSSELPRSERFVLRALRFDRRTSYVDEAPSASFLVLGISYEVLSTRQGAEGPNSSVARPHKLRTFSLCADEQLAMP